MLPDLKDMRVFITGAGRGLGRSVAVHLAKCGAVLGVIDVDGSAAQETADEISKAGGTAYAYSGDVSDKSVMEMAAAEFADQAGRIDTVINNAMLLRYEPIENVEDDTLDKMLGVGIKGPIWGAQALLKHMDPERGGHIINMASPVAYRGFPGTAVYSLVKGATVTLTKTLAAELGPRNIRVNAVAPGSVPTPGAIGLNTKEEYERRSRTIPLRRLGHEQDNANAIAFLLSPEADFINGDILNVDGGIAASV
ncbi:MAG TPA: glucose 1-dehydrogenase [Alphaproteobacteria bacterium]|nr:glucose 1-dehydrogenase [Alphaproteobacteria bacterium]